MASAPTSVSATSTDSTSITVSWTNSDTYSGIEVQYKTLYGTWTTASAVINGGETSYDFTAVSNIAYQFRVRGEDEVTGVMSAWSETSNWCICVLDIISSTLLLSGSSEDVVANTAIGDTNSATIEFSGYSLDAQSISTTYAFYLATSTGAVYQYSGDYKSDAGVVIPCDWQSKQTNFTDQFKELESRQKNIHFARLYYVDLDSTTGVTIKLSNDGGVTWDGTSTKSIGTGNGKNKSADFYFEGGPISGQIFTARIENADAANRLQVTALALYFDAGGEDFSLT